MSSEHKFYEMLDEYVREDAMRSDRDRKLKKNLRLFLMAFILLVSFGVLIYVIYLVYTIRISENEIRKRDEALFTLKQDLNTALYEQYFYEEEAGKYKSLLLDKYPDSEIDLSKEVNQNLEALKNSTIGFKGKNITRGNENFREIALTFDLASGEDLDDLFQYIEKYNINVTVFISNERPDDDNGSLFSRTNKYYIKKMSEMPDRVEFGNHTWSHFNHYRSLMETSLRKRKIHSFISPAPIDKSQMVTEVDRVKERYFKLTGQQLSNIYRLPYGSLNQLLLNAYASIGYENHIMWSHNKYGSLDIPDYILKKYVYKKSEDGSAQLVKNPFYKTREEVITFLEEWEKSDSHGMNGAIILMHLGTPRKYEKLIDILPEFIEKMQKQGYRFVTVSEVLNDKQD